MDARNLITMRTLGTMGQFGNQIVQYAFIRTYARRWGLDYQVPPWAGQYLFGCNDPPVTANLPRWAESYQPYPYESCFGKPIPPAADEVRGHDAWGWFQFDTSWYAPDRQFIESLFVTQGPELDRAATALDRLRARGKTVIGLHLRRGDVGKMISFFLPIGWCLRWLYENWRRFPDPVLFVATEDKSLARHFRGYNAVTAEDLGIEFTTKALPNYKYPFHPKQEEARRMDFFPDWHILRNSDILLCSDSTFSGTAAWLSPTCREFWRARLSIRGFELLDPWNMTWSPREHLNDYPGIPGTQPLERPAAWGAYWPPTWRTHPPVPEDPETWKPFLEPPLWSPS